METRWLPLRLPHSLFVVVVAVLCWLVAVPKVSVVQIPFFLLLLNPHGLLR